MWAQQFDMFQGKAGKTAAVSFLRQHFEVNGRWFTAETVKKSSDGMKTTKNIQAVVVLTWTFLGLPDDAIFCSSLVILHSMLVTEMQGFLFCLDF